MAARHYAEQLDSLVACMLSQGSHELFERHWKLYQDSVYISEPEGFYFRSSQDATYCNIAVAGDNRIVDIEADETSSVSSSGPLRHINQLLPRIIRCRSSPGLHPESSTHTRFITHGGLPRH